MINQIKVSMGLALCLTALGSGCSSSSSQSQPAQPQSDTESSAAIHALYSSDVAGFAQIDSSLAAVSVLSYDQQNNQLFTKIFGGTDAASVEQYYQARIQYAFTLDDLQQATITPGITYQGWLTPPSTSPTPSPSSVAGVQVGALNISTLFWLEGTLSDEPVILTVGDQTIPITSTRVGVMEFGDGYEASFTDDAGNVYDVPAAYRQAILVHEGRHSDCTDGLSEKEVAIMQNATSTDDFLKQIPLPHCGHTHVICTSGTYQGMAACDVERYGAYTVGAIYETAMINAQTDEISQKILQISALDYDSRYIDTGAQSPDELAPNMTSAGLTP